MAFEEIDSLQISSCSTDHSAPRWHDCACHYLGSLQELPSLHAVIDRSPRSLVANLITLLCHILYTISLFLPQRIRYALYLVVIRIDNFCFLVACYIEHVSPRARRLLWDDIVTMPRACCDDVVGEPVRRMSSTLGTYWRTAKTSRTAAMLVKIGWQVDEDVAEILRVVGDWYEQFIDKILAAAPIPEEAMISILDSTPPNPDVLISTPTCVSEYHEAVQEVSSSEGNEDILELYEKPETTIASITLDESKDQEISLALIPVADNSIVKASHPEDEGYVSSEDTGAAPTTSILEESPQSDQIRDQRSLLTSNAASDGDERLVRSPHVSKSQSFYLHPNASTPSLSSPKRIRRQSSFPTQPSRRSTSQSTAEAKRLLTLSTNAVARAHHHWLRPCNACARKAEAGTVRKVERNRLRKAFPSEDAAVVKVEEEEKGEGVVRRTVGWVKKQEEKIKHL